MVIPWPKSQAIQRAMMITIPLMTEAMLNITPVLKEALIQFSISIVIAVVFIGVLYLHNLRRVRSVEAL